MTADRYRRLALPIVASALAALVSVGCPDGGDGAGQVTVDTLKRRPR